MERATDTTRRFEVAVDIAAPAADVWEALTKAEELVRWFPLQAEVEPGAGGRMMWTWGGAWTWDNEIEAWEPGRRLRLVQRDAQSFDAEGRPLPKDGSAPARIVIEFTLEGRGGATTLRLVHSGFGQGARWDDELDATHAGWKHELFSLGHYLTRHRGRDRRMARAQAVTPEPLRTAWARLLGPEGFGISESERRVGAAYANAAIGQPLSGEVAIYLPDRGLTGTVREIGDGLFLLGSHRAAGQTGVMAWLTAHSEDAAPTLAKFETSAAAILSRLFGAPASASGRVDAGPHRAANQGAERA